MSPVKLASIGHLYINASNTTYDEDGNEHSFDDQPSSVTNSNTKFWYYHGKKHREDGPAVLWADGDCDYYQNGHLHRVGGPARCRTSGTDPSTHYYFWFQNGKMHREDGPAWIYGADSFQYFVNGKPHRLDGPASRVQTTSHVHDDVYYINGVRYRPDKYAQAVAHWLSYREVTREEIEQQIGQFRIVEWE